MPPLLHLLHLCAPAAVAGPDAVDAPPPEVSDDDGLETIVVTATRTASPLGDAPVPIEVITRAEIEATGAESLGELLEEQPGLQVDDTVVGTAIRMQGMDPEHTLILVDGQRLLGNKDGVIDLSRFTMENIERIEIVKGPSSALYGADAMGGVVHIVTRAPATGPEAGLHVRFGTLSRIDASGNAAFGGEVVKQRVTGGWHSADAWDLDPSDVATTASAFQQGDASWSAQVTPADDVQIDATASWMQRRMQGIDASATGAVFDTRAIVEEGRASVGGWITTGPKTKLSARMSGSLFRAQQITDQRGASANDTSSDDREQLAESTLQLDHRIDAGALGSHQLTVGVDGLTQSIRSTRLGSGQADRQRLGAFGQDVWRVREEGLQVSVVPGFRLDLDTQFGRALTPRLALVFGLDAVTLRTSLGSGFRAPSFRELYLAFENPGAGYVVQGSSDLRPERSMNANASIELDPQGDFSLAVQGFANRIEDLIAITTVQAGVSGQVFAYDNIDRAETRGIDAQVRWSPGPVSAELGYALTDARDLERDRPLEGRVPHRVTGALQVKLPADVSIRGQSGWSSPRFFYVDADGDGTDERSTVPAQLTADVRAVWKGAAGSVPLDLFVGVDNLFDAGAHTLAPTTPRFFYAGLNLRTGASEDP